MAIDSRNRPRVRPQLATARRYASAPARLSISRGPSRPSSRWPSWPTSSAGCLPVPIRASTVLLRELVADYGYSASYTSLRRRVAGLRPQERAEPELRFKTGPGVQIQGDWTSCGVWPLGDCAAEMHAWVAPAPST